MYKAIYLVDNNTKNPSGLEIPDFDSNVEILPDLPNIDVSQTVPSVQEEEKPSEAEVVGGKFLVSIGYTALCILVILLIVLLIKKIQSSKQSSDSYADDGEYDDNEGENSDSDDYYDENMPDDENLSEEGIVVSQKKVTELGTPNSISMCIRKFLERTRDN